MARSLRAFGMAVALARARAVYLRRILYAEDENDKSQHRQLIYDCKFYYYSVQYMLGEWWKWSFGLSAAIIRCVAYIFRGGRLRRSVRICASPAKLNLIHSNPLFGIQFHLCCYTRTQLPVLPLDTFLFYYDICKLWTLQPNPHTHTHIHTVDAWHVQVIWSWTGGKWRIKH